MTAVLESACEQFQTAKDQHVPHSVGFLFVEVVSGQFCRHALLTKVTDRDRIPCRNSQEKEGHCKKGFTERSIDTLKPLSVQKS